MMMREWIKIMPGSGDRVCCTFTTYNVLGMIFGGMVVGVASWLAGDKRSFFTQLKLLELEEGQVVGEHFQNISVVDYGAFVLVAIGVAIMVQSLLGCTGTFMGCSGNRKARCFLITYGVLVAMVIVMEIVAAVLVMHVYQEWVGEKARQFMEDTIQSDYILPSEGPANSVTVLWDTIMTSLTCCGVNSYLDFQGTEGNAEVPPSCCLTSLNMSTSYTPSPCPDPSTDLLPQMTQGCYPLLLQGSVPALASSLAVVAIFQVAGVILACCLARKVEVTKEWYKMSSM